MIKLITNSNLTFKKQKCNCGIITNKYKSRHRNTKLYKKNKTANYKLKNKTSKYRLKK